MKNKEYKVGYRILPVFAIQFHIKDLCILEKIKSFFGCGVITIRKNKSNKATAAIYSVQYLKDLTLAIIPHFDKYPLLTKKRIDFLLLKKIIELMNKKEHLTKEGLEKIVSLKALINKGLNDELRIEFTNLISEPIPLVDLSNIVFDPS